MGSQTLCQLRKFHTAFESEIAAASEVDLAEAEAAALDSEAAARAGAVSAAAAALDSFRVRFREGPHRMRPLHNNKPVRHKSAWRLQQN